MKSTLKKKIKVLWQSFFFLIFRVKARIKRINVMNVQKTLFIQSDILFYYPELETSIYNSLKKTDKRVYLFFRYVSFNRGRSLTENETV
ncbi:hypothetical protein AC241_13090 [Bacillus thuringiensis]|nr:hypothetical protein AC241_13090 [Bacillus thuringiensis]